MIPMEGGKKEGCVAWKHSKDFSYCFGLILVMIFTLFWISNYIKREYEIFVFTENGCTCKGTHVLTFHSSFQDFVSVNEKKIFFHLLFFFLVKNEPENGWFRLWNLWLNSLGIRFLFDTQDKKELHVEPTHKLIFIN